MQIENASERLDGEWFFDGQFWRNWEGAMLEFHPSI